MALPELDAAAFKLMVVELVAADDCELALAAVSILKTEFGLMVTNVSPNVLGVDEGPGE